MFSRIDIGGGFGVTRSTSHTAQRTTADSAKAGIQNYDFMSFSQMPEGQELRTKDLTAQISGQARIRPTHGDIQTIKRQVEEGTYVPDAGEIAARMLLINKED